MITPSTLQRLRVLQYDDAQSRGSQLPTSKAGPSGRPGPPAPQPGYSGAPQYHPSPQAYGSNGPLPAGSVPAYPSGQYPAQQRSGPPSNSQGGYHGYAPPGPSGPASGSMGGFNPYGPPPGGAYGQPPPGGPSMASMLNPFSMISSVSQMGEPRPCVLIAHCTSVLADGCRSACCSIAVAELR